MKSELLQLRCFTISNAGMAPVMGNRQQTMSSSISNGSKVSRKSGAIQSANPNLLYSERISVQPQACSGQSANPNLLYSNANVRSLHIVPVRAQIPICYTRHPLRLMTQAVPVRAQIPICYTRKSENGFRFKVPVRAQIPICYTSDV